MITEELAIEIIISLGLFGIGAWIGYSLTFARQRDKLREKKKNYKPQNRFEEMCREMGVWGIHSTHHRHLTDHACVSLFCRSEKCLEYSSSVLKMPEWVQRAIVHHEKVHIEQPLITFLLKPEQVAYNEGKEYFIEKHGDKDGRLINSIFRMFINEGLFTVDMVTELVKGEHAELLEKAMA